MVRVPGFLPSTSGLHFDNRFPNVPLEEIDLGVAKIPLGNAANGLCGGMVFAVRDYFQAGRLPPPAPGNNPPELNDPLFDYLVDRLYDSFDLPTGLLRYLALMNPALPDDESWKSRLFLAPHGRSWVMIKSEWPKIQADLDSGQLAPVGLIRVITSDVLKLGLNHHVLAYGYDLNSDILSINIYDPNYHDKDDVTLSLSLADPMHATRIAYSPNDEPLYCFIRTDCQPSRQTLPP
jgi:hypothetical protein